MTIFPYFAIYSEPLCATCASFGGGWSHIEVLTGKEHPPPPLSQSMDTSYATCDIKMCYRVKIYILVVGVSLDV